ncbi:DUF6888 family protein [Desmonostoc muscorum]|uniref:DUF6888 family protein n=1 Tax=Desmonostoc muscorum TaxID=1179 RepID=UPI00359F401B
MYLYLKISFLSLDERTGNIYILAGEETGIVIRENFGVDCPLSLVICRWFCLTNHLGLLWKQNGHKKICKNYHIRIQKSEWATPSCANRIQNSRN